MVDPRKLRLEHPLPKKAEWVTPPALLALIERVLGWRFTLDVATSRTNPLSLAKFYTEAEDALIQPWDPPQELESRGSQIATPAAWLNPPGYTTETLPPWLERAWTESQRGIHVAVLAPCDLSTGWFHDQVWPRASRVLPIYGRIQYYQETPQGLRPGPGSPRWGSMVLAYEPNPWRDPNPFFDLIEWRTTKTRKKRERSEWRQKKLN